MTIASLCSGTNVSREWKTKALNDRSESYLNGSSRHVHKITVVFIIIIIYDSYGNSTDNFCQTAGLCCSRCLIKGWCTELTV